MKGSKRRPLLRDKKERNLNSYEDGWDRIFNKQEKDVKDPDDNDTYDWVEDEEYMADIDELNFEHAAQDSGDCPHCGVMYEEGDVFCGDCGARLMEEESGA